jgi:hypothetical protein
VSPGVIFDRIHSVVPAALAAFFASCLFSQTLTVYSEFTRLDANGVVRAPADPREILSPMLVRNGFTSFQIAVEAKPGESYTLFVGLNPQNAVKVTLYRESAERLDPVDLPFKAEGPAAFWLDVWCDEGAPVRRIKIEPELYADGDFARYPMEARVMDATVPHQTRAILADLRQFLCGADSTSDEIQKMHDRNGRQDAALSRGIAKPDLIRNLRGCQALAENPEAYLRIRDDLFRLR